VIFCGERRIEIAGDNEMAKHKRLTELAMQKQREAYCNRLKAEDKGVSGYLDVK
jgi:hypothetical protein